MDNGNVEPTMAELSEEIRELRAENARLHLRVTRMEGGDTPQVETIRRDSATDIPVADQRVSRRGALMALGGVAAGGLELAAGSSMLGATPAAATSDGGTEGGALILGAAGGNANSASSSTQVLTSAGVGLAGGTGQTGQSGVEGQDLTTKSPYGFGVTGTSDGGTGVEGQSTNGTGVQGVAASPSGIIGSSTFPFTGLGAGVVGDTSGFGPGVLGLSPSSSGGVYGLCVAATGLADELDLGTFPAGVFGDCSANVSPGGVGVAGFGNGFGTYGATGGSSGLLFTVLDGGAGVVGESNHSPGIVGLSSTAAGAVGATGADGQTGVEGLDLSATGGVGTSGTSTKGVGVSAVSTSGTALQVEGVARFSRSGTARVAGTASRSAQSVKVSGVALTDSSLVLVTPQGKVGGRRRRRGGGRRGRRLVHHFADRGHRGPTEDRLAGHRPCYMRSGAAGAPARNGTGPSLRAAPAHVSSSHARHSSRR